jgi:hypothetical protein
VSKKAFVDSHFKWLDCFDCYRAILKEEQQTRKSKLIFDINSEGKNIIVAGTPSELLKCITDKEYIGKHDTALSLSLHTIPHHITPFLSPHTLFSLSP